MPEYTAPGVFIEEIAEVETAIPAFIGFTEKSEDGQGNDLQNKPTRISSMLEFEEFFGKAAFEEIKIDITETLINNKLENTTVTFSEDTQHNIFGKGDRPPKLPKGLLYYCMKMFFANGGGDCYVVSIGDLSDFPELQYFTDALNILEQEDEPTLILFPDALNFWSSDAVVEDVNSLVNSVIDAGLAHCKKMQDRFLIADVFNAIEGGIDSNEKINNNLRNKITTDANSLKYGAMYYPYLKTDIPIAVNDESIIINHIIHDANGNEMSDSDLPEGIKRLSNSFIENNSSLQQTITNFVSNNAVVVLPPSSAVAGIYARVDKDGGVWKSPANQHFNRVLDTMVDVTSDFNSQLNVDINSGKSINAIRHFTGSGILVFGARTLAGNDNEYRYIPVRRFLNFVDESIKKSLEPFIFEPNDANTWGKVKSIIENFLTLKFREEALAGSAPDQAYYVSVGLGQTMTSDDILNGILKVEIGLSVIRPAEFITLRFVQKMQEL